MTTYHFPRAIEGGQLVVEYATVCFRNYEDFGPIASGQLWNAFHKRSPAVGIPASSMRR
jgi:hypothetical protein